MIVRTYSGMITAAAVLLLLPCMSSSAPGDTAIESPRGIVDCLLPGAMRRVGGNIYQMPQRPARITATECTIRGGDFLLYDRANYEASLKHWIAKAEQDKGDSEAMLYVAEIYEQGIGRDPDFDAAARWYQRAADAGSTTAMIGLAHLYKTGQGVAVDLGAAQSLYSQAFGSDVMIPLDPSSVKGADQRVETLVAEVDEIRREKIAVELELAATNQQLDGARQALSDTLAGSGAESGEIKRLQASIDKQQADIASYRLDAENIRSENEQLYSLRQQLKNQGGETEKLQELLDTAESEYKRNREYLRAEREALEAEETRFNDLLGEMDTNRAVIQASKVEVDQLRERVNTVEDELHKAEDDRDFYQALASERTSPEERIAALSAQITLMEQKSSGIENQSTTLKNAVKTKQDELDAQIGVAAKADELSHEEIAARDREIARLHAAISRAETEKERHTSDISRLERQSNELEALRANLEREQAQSNRLQQLLTETQEKFSASNEKLEQLTASRVALESEIESLTAAAFNDETSQVILAQRRQELTAALGETEQLQLQIAESEEEFRQYRQQMTDTAARQTDAIANLRAAVAAGRAERVLLEEQLNSANQQLVSAQSDLNLEQQRFAELQDELRLARTEKDDSTGRLEDKQRKLDEQNQQLAMLQQEIDRLNDQSNRYVTQINELTVMAQAEKIEFAGPSIILMEPNDSVLASNDGPATRGGALTRGISVVAATRINETKVIRGHIDAPAGLAKLTINGMQVAYDSHNSFTQPFELDEESKRIRIVAVDHNGKDDSREFEYRTDGTVLQATTVHSKAARFEESRNTALDHLQYYALIIANKDYENERFRDLETPFDDAEEVAEVLRDRYRFEVDIIYNANKAKIEEELERIFYKEPNDDDVENDKDAVLIYYAGHGYASDSRTKEAYYWLPTDAEFDSPRTWYKTKDLEAYMQVSAINQIMVIADSCFAGSVLSRDGLAGNHASLKAKDWRRYLTEYTEKKKSRYVLTSGGFAPVLDGGGSGNHSVFARAFLDVLESNTEILSAPRMHEQVAPEVMKLAARLDHKQTPLFGYLTSAGHEFGNFYLPAPHAKTETTAGVEIDFITPKNLFAEAALQ